MPKCQFADPYGMNRCDIDVDESGSFCDFHSNPLAARENATFGFEYSPNEIRPVVAVRPSVAFRNMKEVTARLPFENAYDISPKAPQSLNPASTSIDANPKPHPEYLNEKFPIVRGKIKTGNQIRQSATNSSLLSKQFPSDEIMKSRLDIIDSDVDVWHTLDREYGNAVDYLRDGEEIIARLKIVGILNMPGTDVSKKYGPGEIIMARSIIKQTEATRVIFVIDELKKARYRANEQHTSDFKTSIKSPCDDLSKFCCMCCTETCGEQCMVDSCVPTCCITSSSEASSSSEYSSYRKTNTLFTQLWLGEKTFVGCHAEIVDSSTIARSWGGVKTTYGSVHLSNVGLNAVHNSTGGINFAATVNRKPSQFAACFCCCGPPGIELSTLFWNASGDMEDDEMTLIRRMYAHVEGTCDLPRQNGHDTYVEMQKSSRLRTVTIVYNDPTHGGSARKTVVIVSPEVPPSQVFEFATQCPPSACDSKGTYSTHIGLDDIENQLDRVVDGEYNPSIAFLSMAILRKAKCKNWIPFAMCGPVMFVIIILIIVLVAYV